MFADTLDEVEGNVALIRRQILLSGGIALAVALLAGYLVARALSQRVGRLEHAARKVAAGDFSNPIRADSDDELGQLAAAFDDMQNQLARLDRARKQFIASASHELRTPIFSLGGFLELLADEDLDEETRRQFLDQLRGQVDRMRKLATELLDLSRLEAGALELRPEPTDVGQLAREVAGEFTPAAQRHDSRGARSTSPTSRSSSTATPSGSPRCFVSCSTTRSCTRRRAPECGFRPPAGTGTCDWRCPTSAWGSSARTCLTSSNRSSPPTRRPRAPASAWRSRASWPSGCRAA